MNKKSKVCIIYNENSYCDDEYISGNVVSTKPLGDTPAEEQPYIQTLITVEAVRKQYNPNYGDNKLCKCGHTYYRHFDSYENMAPVGCKYCGCDEFIPADSEEPTTEKVICDICGKEVDEVFTVCSSFGGFSVGCCSDCLASGKERYGDLVAYISCAGRFPDDINEVYRKEVRRQLVLHGISEEQFIKDVDDAISKERDFFTQEA